MLCQYLMKESDMELREYIGKRVKITDIDNKEWIGKATGLDLAINDDAMEYDELFFKKMAA